MRETKKRKEMKGGAIAFIRRNIAAVTAPAVIALATVNNAMAEMSADTIKSNMKSQLGGWLGALGFLIAVMGAAQWGWGYLRDDPEGKARGWKMIVGGAIVGAAITIATQLGF